MSLMNKWREKREQAGLSLTQASTELGIGKSMLSQLENGLAHTTTRIVAKACVLYRCEPSDLMPVVDGEKSGDSILMPVG